MPTFRSVSTNGSTTTTTYTVPKPTGTVQGDMLILCQSADLGQMGGMGTPSGGASWGPPPLQSQQWASAAINQAGARIYWKLAGASEPASYSVSHGTNGFGCTTIVCVQNPGPGTPVSDFSKATTPATSIPTPSTTPTSSADFEIRFVCAFDGNGSPTTFTPPAGFTERADTAAPDGSSLPMTCATRTLTSSAATGVHNFVSVNSLVNYIAFTVDIAAVPAPWFIGWGQPL